MMLRFYQNKWTKYSINITFTFSKSFFKVSPHRWFISDSLHTATPSHINTQTPLASLCIFKRTQWLTAFAYLTKTLLFRMSPQVLLQISSTQSFNRSASLSSELLIISLIISVIAQESCRCSYHFQKLWQVRKDQRGNRLSFLCTHDFSILYTISKPNKKIAQ